MKVLTEYTLNYLKKNKKNTLSISIIISIAVILLSTMVLITYMNWNYEIDKAVLANGNYHGTFKSPISKSQIPYLEENQKIDMVYLKTEYIGGKVDLKRSYMDISYLDKAYWDNMGEENLILEGRIPDNKYELAVVGNLIKENPLYKIGDKLNIIHEYGESGIENHTEEYTIVGIISGNSLSYEPYWGWGFLDRESIDDNIRIKPFLRMINPRQVYKDLPEIGERLGLNIEEDLDKEYQYSARYNAEYLSLYGIFPPSYKVVEQRSNAVFVTTVLILLIMFMFSIMIYSAFAVWSYNRVRQLGIFKSVGATPKQIRKTIIREALYLAIGPITIGIGLGHMFCYIFIDRVKSMADANLDGSIFNMAFKTSPLIIISIIILSFLMIWFSIARTAGRISRISPIDAIGYSGVNHNNSKNNKRDSENYISGNIIPSLSRDSLKANKKGFRTTIIAMGISFCILFTFVVVMSGVKADRKLNSLESYYNIFANFYSNEYLDENMFEEIEKIPEIRDKIVYKILYGLYKVEEKYESDDFSSLGGFKDIDSRKFSVRPIDGCYEVGGQLLGMEDKKFNEYALSLDQDPEMYYGGKMPKAIFLNLVKENIDEPVSRTRYIPFLNDNINSISFVSYAAYGNIDFNHEIEILHKTIERPLRDFYTANYEVILIMPKSVLNLMMEEFSVPANDMESARYSNNHREYLRIVANDEDIEGIKEDIKKIAKYYIPESDYYMDDEISYAKTVEASRKILYLMAFSFIAFMVTIGISNSYSSINNNLRSRRREFAMLKSMGMTKDGIKKMLRLEGIYYSIYPFIYSIPLGFVILIGIAKTNRLYGVRDLLFYLDYRIMLIYILITILSIYSAYYFGIRKIEKDEIVDVLRDESI